MSSQQKIEDLTILYIEDDAITRKNIAHFLRPQCKELYTAVNGQEGFETYKKEEPDIVITDIEMPVLNGLDMAKKIREISISTQIIIISAYKKPKYLMEAVNLQLTQYLVKPISCEKISAVLEIASTHLNKEKVETKTFISDDLYYDNYVKELIEGDKIISLSKYERALIELLISKYPAPASYDLINSNVYNYGASKNAIKLLINSLREKISKQSVVNVSGFGYKMKLRGKK